MATQTKTRKPAGVDVTTDWDGITAPEVIIPQDDFEWTLKVTVNGVSTTTDYVGVRPKK